METLAFIGWALALAFFWMYWAEKAKVARLKYFIDRMQK